MSDDLRRDIPSDGRPEPFLRSLAATSGLHPVERFIDLELNGFLPDLNLNYTDKMAMQEGVEVRVPLVDTRLVDYAAGLPIGDRIDPWTTKKILRDSQRLRLPASVLDRSKQGFGVPIRSWLAGPARDLLEELTAPSVIGARGLFDSARVSRVKDGFQGGPTRRPTSSRSSASSCGAARSTPRPRRATKKFCSRAPADLGLPTATTWSR